MFVTTAPDSFGALFNLKPNDAKSHHETSSNFVSTKKATISTLLKLVSKKDFINFCNELKSFSSVVISESLTEGQRKNQRSIQVLRQRLFAILHLSFLQSISCYQLFRKEKEAGDVHSYQTILEFLKKLWESALAQKQDSKSKRAGQSRTKAVSQRSQNAQRLFYTVADMNTRRERAAWLGTKAFAFDYCNTKLTQSHKKSINGILLALEPHYNADTSEFLISSPGNPTTSKEKSFRIDFPISYENIYATAQMRFILRKSILLGQAQLDHSNLCLRSFLKKIWCQFIKGPGVFKDSAKDSVLNKISHIIKSSFLKIKVLTPLGNQNQINTYFVDNFDKKIFEFLKHLCSFALFGKADSTSEYFVGLEEKINKNKKFQEIRRILSADGDDELLGEQASWHATKIFASWVWSEELTPERQRKAERQIKTLIENRSITPSHKSEIVEDNGLISNQALTKGKRTVLSTCAKTLGRERLEEAFINLDQFLQYIVDTWTTQEHCLFKRKLPEYITRRIAYVMETSFLKLKIFSSFEMGGLSRADFVDEFEAKAYRLLKFFWTLVLFDKHEHLTQEDLERKESFDVEKFLQYAKTSITTKAGSEAKLDPASWQSTLFCVQWLWYEELSAYQKSKINNIILRLGSHNEALLRLQAVHFRRIFLYYNYLYQQCISTFPATVVDCIHTYSIFVFIVY
ncbi:hypothetical protein O181_007832 [Austropuccinia psidii MF-1]|uniref:Uncharacterized protein n=1 Tax=Austropuccinia psidii MF-1 TaxID=1389203 RepID=A0A9Q3GIV8_9BASI|nr:hypothetical protein [Austropuccinia psidii MF-1]